MYWSANIFHLPRGDYSNSQAIFECISPEHRALINDINIDLSLADLTPPLLQSLERKLYDDQGGRLPSDDSSQEWSFWTSRLLLEIWEEKIKWIQRNFSHAPNIFVTCFEDPVMDFWYDGNLLENEIAGFRNKILPDPSMGLVLQYTRQRAGWRVRDRVQQVGWDNFKEELAAGGWGRTKNEQWCSEPSKIVY